MRKVVMTICLLALSGCSTVTVLEANKGSEERIGSQPKIGIESKATAGNSLYSQFRYWSRTGYRIKNAFSTRLALSKVVVAEGDFYIKRLLKDRCCFVPRRLR
jgi:uncharacterized protein YceK